MIASWKESCDKPRHSMLKSRDITLPTKVQRVKAMVFPVVMYGCESWTVKKAEPLWIDALELWSWRKLLWVLWTARRSNQSILKEINPEYSLEGLMLKLKLQYFGHLIMNSWLIGKVSDSGKDSGQKKRVSEDEMTEWHHWHNRHELGQTPGDVRDREACRAVVYGVAESQTWLGD